MDGFYFNSGKRVSETTQIRNRYGESRTQRKGELNKRRKKHGFGG